MYKFIKQDGIKDCGVCALYNILKYYKISISLEKLREMTKTNDTGTSIYNIVKASNDLGLKADAYYLKLDDLKKISYPSIAYMKIEDYYHFVILKKVDDYIYFFDPIRGDLKLSKDEFINEWQNIIISFKYDNNKPLTNLNLNNYFHNLFKQYKTKIIFLSLLIFLTSLVNLLCSLFFKSLIEYKSLYVFVSLIFLLLNIFKFLLNNIEERALIKFNNKINEKIRFDTYEKIFNLPTLYHHNRPTGDIVSKVNDLSYIKEVFYELTFNFVMNIILIIVILIYFIIFNRKNILMILSLSLFIFLIQIIFRKKLNRYINLDTLNNSKVHINFIDDLKNIDTIKNLNIEKNIIKKQKKIFISYLQNNKKLSKLSTLYELLIDLLVSVGNICLLFIDISNLKISNLILLNSLYLLYFENLKKIINLDNLLLVSKNAYRRLVDLFNYRYDDGNININSINKIEFLKVYYSYDDIYNTLDNFNLKIYKNEYLLVDGDSGVGKSTIFKLLNKEIKLEEGTIKIDDIDINCISNKSLKENICYVAQNESLFTDTILNNLKLYKNITSEEINKVVKVCMIDEILEKRNINLDYLLEENGQNLSGGERQRLILGRTLLRNTDFIILDETMNEIDIKTERKIIKNIKTEYKKTIILITHRNNNKDLFDRIIKIKGGKNEKINT